MGLSTPLQLPVIYLSDETLKPGCSKWVEVRSNVRKALEEYGCFEVSYDRVSEELKQSVLGAMEELFELPLEAKQRNVSPKPYTGYSSHNGLSESLGIQDAEVLEKVDEFVQLLRPDYEGNKKTSETIQKFTEKLAELDVMVRRMVMESFGIEKYLDEHLNSTNYRLRLMKYVAPPDVDDANVVATTNGVQDVANGAKTNDNGNDSASVIVNADVSGAVGNANVGVNNNANGDEDAKTGDCASVKSLSSKYAQVGSGANVGVSDDGAVVDAGVVAHHDGNNVDEANGDGDANANGGVVAHHDANNVDEAKNGDGDANGGVDAHHDANNVDEAKNGDDEANGNGGVVSHHDANNVDEANGDCDAKANGGAVVHHDANNVDKGNGDCDANANGGVVAHHDANNVDKGNGDCDANGNGNGGGVVAHNANNVVEANGDVEEKKLGLPSHTDKNLFTVLYQYEIEGLEVKTKDDKWIRLKPSHNSFVVMAGDSLYGLMNGRISRPFHRVRVTEKKKTRYSIALFSTPKGDYIIEPPKELVDEKHPRVLKPFTYVDLMSFYHTEAGRRAPSTLHAYCAVSPEAINV